jgi:ABC transporter substrate binding protein (PQQ-dependent alcohol dehydrogenase system)
LPGRHFTAFMRGICFTALFFVVVHAFPASADTVLTIGHVQLKKDSTYGKSRTRAQYLLQPLGRPWAGSKIALEEVKWHGAAAGVTFALDRAKVRKPDGVADAIRKMAAEKGISFFVLDLPADVMAEAASALKDDPVLLFNVSAREDTLRGAACQPNLLHVIPSHAMLADALGQYLVFRKWDEVLLLVGPEPSDKAWAEAFKRTASRYGIDIDEERPFVLSNDPRLRAENNPILLTSGADYDVVFVADTDGEFARNLNYTIKDPRPIVGADGLAPLAWHWSWERHGAPQLENRFQEAAGRPMRGVDWAAWMAVKTVAEAVQRTANVDFSALSDYIRGSEIVIDGFKGNRLNFRPWNGQLRQPILLATHNWVVERAPIDGFLHQTNNMDTLGRDERESDCNR